ncbi:MAG TPA: glycosyltransferase family 4 protein [Myxococcota bacterium]|nr:glycosyltransferase family 4 protein [Myxococcota bacterium]
MSAAARPLRIAFVAYRGNMNCGGQGVYLWFLARELARLGHEIDVLVGPPYPDPMPFARSVERLPNPQYWGGWFNRDRSKMLPRPIRRVFSPLNFYELAASRMGFLPEPFAFSVRALRALSARIRHGARYDLVHDVQCLGWGLLPLLRMGLPVVSTVHHPLSVDRRASFHRDRTLREALGTMEFYPVGMQAAVARRLDCIFTSSAVSARALERDFGVPTRKLRMVANGVDTELFRPDLSVPRDPRMILCVGRASDPNKGVRTLIEALALVPAPAHVVLVDDDHRDNPARGWAERAGVAQRVQIAGRVDSATLVSLYRRAAVVAVPSRYEGFGLPAVEAMACETPVVARAAGALPEVVGTGGGGLLVDGTPHAMARGLRDLLADPHLRARLGEQGRKGVAAAYAWPSVAARTAGVYAELLEVRRGRPASTRTSAASGQRVAS